MSQRPLVPFDLAAAIEESRDLIEAADAAREERERRRQAATVAGQTIAVAPAVAPVPEWVTAESWDPVVG